MKLLKSSSYHRSCRAALTAILLSRVYSIGWVSASASSQTTGGSSATVNPTKKAFVSNHQNHRDADLASSSSNRPPRRRLDLLDDYDEYHPSSPTSTSTSTSTSTASSFARTNSHRHASTAASAAAAVSPSSHDTNSNSNRIGVPPVRIGGMLIQDDGDIISRQQQQQQQQQRRPSLSNHSNHNTNRKKTSSSHHALSNLQGGSVATTRTFDSESPQPKPQQPQQQRAPPSPPTTNNTNRLLQISLSLVLSTTSLRNSSTPLATYLDTGAQVTVMTFAAVQKAGLAHLIDTRYAGHACGVGGVCVKVLGRIPAQTVSFWVDAAAAVQHSEGEAQTQAQPQAQPSLLKKRRIDSSPAITVLENQMEDGVELLLGLDVLEEWQALICLRDRTLTVRNCNGARRSSSSSSSSSHGGSAASASTRSSHSANDLVIPFVRPSNDGGGSVRTVRRTRRKDTTTIITSSLDHRSGGGGGSSGLSRPSSSSSSSLTNHNHHHNHKTTNHKPKRPIANFHSLDDTATSDYSDLESDLDILDKTSNHIEWDDPSTPPSYWDEIKSRNDWSDHDDTILSSDHHHHDDDDYDLLHGYDDYEEEDEDDIFSSESDQDDLAGCDLSGI